MMTMLVGHTAWYINYYCNTKSLVCVSSWERDTFLLLQLIATAVAGFVSVHRAQPFPRSTSTNIDTCIAGPIVCIHLLVSFSEREQTHLALHI